MTNYALTVLENHSTSKDDVDVLESFLLKAAIISPGSMARICELLINIEHRTKRVSKQRVGPRFTELAERNLTNGNLYEVVWQLYALRGLGIHLESRAISEMAESTSSSALGLVLLDLDERGLCVRKLPKSHWEAAITKDRVRSDWMWLLAYEGFRHGWLSDTKGVMGDGFFAPLAKRDVVFYDPKRNVRRTSQTARLRARLRKKSFEEITKFFLGIRGVNVFDGDY